MWDIHFAITRKKQLSERNLSGQTLGWTNRDTIARCIFDLQDKRTRKHACDKSIKSFASEFRTYSISHTIRRFVNDGYWKSALPGRGRVCCSHLRAHTLPHIVALFEWTGFFILDSNPRDLTWVWHNVRVPRRIRCGYFPFALHRRFIHRGKRWSTLEKMGKSIAR